MTEPKFVNSVLGLLEYLEHLEADNKGLDLEDTLIVIESDTGDVYEEGVTLSVEKTYSYKDGHRWALVIKPETT